MDTIDGAGVSAILAEIAGLMERNRERLRELDRIIGDGDLGVTMSKGFAAAAAEAENSPEPDPGKLFAKAGLAINRHAPSTMGTLMATGFMRGGKAAANRGPLAARDFADFLRAFLEGVMERGKAKPGDKTVVDAIKPAAEAAGRAAEAGRSLGETVAEAVAGAEAGLAAARPWMSQHGKSAVFREKTIGLEDPGAVAFCLVMRGFAEAVSA
ncbi:MAG: DAK2 domain-containing protein [Planctomycetota bacterium]|jgi:dihydroxyacetone kinase-like protein|nr:DAK2 domain-containing protein [Planctomycetota bacterium]